MPRNAAAFEVERDAYPNRAGVKFPAGAFYFMINEHGRKNGIIHGCPCGCGGRSAMWFEGEQNAGGPKWSVVGDWPKVTLTPSIGIGKNQATGVYHWHGYLRAGVFVEE